MNGPIVWEAHASYVLGLLFSPDDHTLASSGMDNVVKLWAVPGGKVQLWRVELWALEGELPVGTNVVTGLAFSPRGRWLAVGAADRKIRVWELG